MCNLIVKIIMPLGKKIYYSGAAVYINSGTLKLLVFILVNSRLAPSNQQQPVSLSDSSLAYSDVNNFPIYILFLLPC